MKEEKQKEKKEKISLKEKLVSFYKGIPSFFREVWFMVKFIVLLFFVLIEYILQSPKSKKLDKPKKKIRINLEPIRKIYSGIYIKVLAVLDRNTSRDIKTSDLIFLALKNLSAKKNRTFVTIGGMAMGFGAVILLLSLGYGFEKLVISRIASLSEMKQINVFVSQGSPLTFSSEVLNEITEIGGVDTTIPIISMVSNVTYNNAVSDVLVYGVGSRYFEELGLKPVKGDLFEDELTKIESANEIEPKGVVAGASSTLVSTGSFGMEISKVHYSIYPLVWKPVYESPDKDSRILGYTKREPGVQDGIEVWGKGNNTNNTDSEAIDLQGNIYSPWVKSSFLLWNKEKCSLQSPDCVDKEYVVNRDLEHQKLAEGYIDFDKVDVSRYRITEGSSLEIYTGKIVDQISFRIDTEEYTNIYFDPKEESLVAAITNNDGEKIYKGELLYGSYYSPNEGYFSSDKNGVKYGYWIKSTLDLWGEEDCNKLCQTYLTYDKPDLIKNSITIYVKANDIDLVGENTEDIFSQVLGEETSAEEEDEYLDIAQLAQEDDTIDWVSLASDLGAQEEIAKDIKNLPIDAQRIVVVNTAMLNLLGIDASKAIGVKFDATLIFDSKLFDKSNYIVESESTEFEVIGVVSDSKSPTFYSPINDLMVDGIVNVSQVTVISKNQESVAKIREKVEGMGFQTVSVVDTVDRISSVFKTLRIALLILGLIALSVASLGMFNTLTVSLLEKTREVGLLKIMGVKSREVKVLFLAESMIMSIFGGLSGLILGFLVGKLLSVLISILAIAQGQAFVDVSYIPYLLGFGIIAISSVVGVFTGYYPAKKATQVSALDALRYE